MDIDKFETFKMLFKKYTDGRRWLNARIDMRINVDKDKKDFEELVVNPMLDAWLKLSDEEKYFWEMVGYAVEIFNGKIIINTGPS